MVKKNSIPERWRSLNAVGQRVPGSRFIAFKVPLKGVTNQRVTQNQKFTPKDLISAIRSQNEELGLIIDLTNTERYYTTKDLPKSVQYVKLHTAGLKIPDDATIHQFKRVVYKFLAANSDNDKLIGVHCTTGINRTGYLICRYLIDVDGWRPLNALSAFGQARTHPIEGTVYIEDIVKGAPRSNAGIDLPPTIEETRAWDTGSYYDSANMSRTREDTIRPLLELIPGNEYADFDARDRRPVPLMRARSDEYQDDGRDYYNQRPDFRGRGPPLGDMNGDLDLRDRNLPSGRPEHMNAPERFRRPGDFNPDGRFNPEIESRRNYNGPDPRPFMDGRDNYGAREVQRPRGMPHEQMGYDDRMRARQDHPGQGYGEYTEPPSYRGQSYPPGNMNNAEYDDIEADPRPLNVELEFRERLLRQKYQSMENESQRYDPREREAMNDSFKGPFHDRMNPRNARPLDGPMNARNPQLRGEPVNEMMHPRDRRDMEAPVQERMHPRDPRFMEGPLNERFPQREAQGMRNAMDERMRVGDARPMHGPVNERLQPRDAQFMEGPGTSRAYPRDPRQMAASTNDQMQMRVSRLMDVPVNERLNAREAQPMENPINDRIPQRDSRVLNRPGNEMMNPREGPMNARIHPRIDRSMEGPANDQMHSREGAMYERLPLRDPQALEGLRNEIMYQRDMRTMQGSMNEQMHPRDPRTMEAPMNDRMYQQEAEYPVAKQRDFMNDTRPFEGRKMNPSEDSLRGTNRFAPYPSLMKPGQPSEVARGLPRPDNRDPRDMMPPSQEGVRFPTRSRFN